MNVVAAIPIEDLDPSTADLFNGLVAPHKQWFPANAHYASPIITVPGQNGLTISLSGEEYWLGWMWPTIARRDGSIGLFLDTEFPELWQNLPLRLHWLVVGYSDLSELGLPGNGIPGSFPDSMPNWLTDQDPPPTSLDGATCMWDYYAVMIDFGIPPKRSHIFRPSANSWEQLVELVAWVYRNGAGFPSVSEIRQAHASQ